MKIIENRPNGTKRVYTKNDEVTKTDQQFYKETDVNYIMQKYMKTGQISHLAKHRGQFADVAEIPDLLTAMSQVAYAQQTFDALPAEIRKRFGNSPVAMVEFLKDPANDREAVKLGLKEFKPGIDKIDPEPSVSAVETPPKPTKTPKTQKTDQD